MVPSGQWLHQLSLHCPCVIPLVLIEEQSGKTTIRDEAKSGHFWLM